MRVISLGSGSSGNALLVEAGPRGRTKILVDAGFSGRILSQRLRSAGISPAQLQAILITHEHTDHILGLPTLLKRSTAPVIADQRTLEAIEQIFASGYLDTENSGVQRAEPAARVWSVPNSPQSGVQGAEPTAGVWGVPNSTLSSEWVGGEKKLYSPDDTPFIPWRQPLSAGSRCIIGDIEVISFPVSHDAVAPCGYLLSAGGCRVCVAIDSGEVTSTMLEAMSQADLLVIESNHDREKLLRGPYPHLLKMRILSPTGHLSNDQAADAVLRTWRSDGVRWLWLSHLSRTNNTPKLALDSMRARLQAAKANLAQVHISVSPPGMGGVWDSTQLWHLPSLWEMSG